MPASAPHVDLVLRYSASPLRPEEAIGAHQRVAADEGAVWFGKLGKPLAQSAIDRFTAQIDSGSKTMLYVATRVGPEVISHKGEMLAITNDTSVPTFDEIPEYYRDFDFAGGIGTWVKVRHLSKLSEQKLRALKTQSTGKPIFGAILSGRRSYHYVG